MIRMFEKILVPIDGSPVAIEAATVAKSIAEKFNSKITLIHVIHHAAYSVSDTPLPASLIKGLDDDGNQIIDQALEIFQNFNGEVIKKIEYGHPGIKITEFCNNNNYSLVVMGNRGISKVAKLLLGSVSNYVLHYASCPTLIVHNKK